MKKMSAIIALLILVLSSHAQDDPRCIHLMGIPLEGIIDSVAQRLQAGGFTAWGQSDDGEDYYYRGKFYGIRAKLLVTIKPETRLVTSAYITIGPYSTESMLMKNQQYFLYKLQQEHGDFKQRDDSWYYMDDFGSIKFTIADNDNGSHDIRVLYFASGAYYKDALSMGLHGPVQEVVTENAVAEEQFMRFAENGQIENPDLIERQYDSYGYLTHARMTEKEGHSEVEYTYDSRYRLVRRTLTNTVANITYINEYTYNDEGEIASQNQKVYDKKKECVMTINMRNNYLTRDDEGNWTTNSLALSYWEKGQQSQQTTVLQKRTIAYWE